jgi:mannose-6-phosphate isomerase-like protein (cupin superfamily)
MDRRAQTIGAIALVIAVAPLMLGAGSGATVWKRAQLQSLESRLSRELDTQRAASEVLGSYGNHHVEIAHREGTGNAELHETQNDVFFILSGEATLIEGGTLVDPKPTEPNEIEAKAINGGVRTKLGPGDVVHIPFKVPHQLIVEPGKQLTYFVVKIDAH